MGKEGRPRLTQHVRRIVRNAVSPQQLNKLFLIIPPGMMRRLILDVGDDAICLRCAHAEGAITFLPGETRSRRSRVIEPFRRTALYRLHRLRERHRWGHNEESVNVIGCAADLDGFESMIFCNALHVAPEFWVKIIGKILLPVLCRKNYVHAIAGVCVRHGSSLRDLISKSIAYPALEALG